MPTWTDRRIAKRIARTTPLTYQQALAALPLTRPAPEKGHATLTAGACTLPITGEDPITITSPGRDVTVIATSTPMAVAEALVPADSIRVVQPLDPDPDALRAPRPGEDSGVIAIVLTSGAVTRAMSRPQAQWRAFLTALTRITHRGCGATIILTDHSGLLPAAIHSRMESLEEGFHRGPTGARAAQRLSGSGLPNSLARPGCEVYADADGGMRRVRLTPMAATADGRHDSVFQTLRLGPSTDALCVPVRTTTGPCSTAHSLVIAAGAPGSGRTSLGHAACWIAGAATVITATPEDWVNTPATVITFEPGQVPGAATLARFTSAVEAHPEHPAVIEVPLPAADVLATARTATTVITLADAPDDIDPDLADAASVLRYRTQTGMEGLRTGECLTPDGALISVQTNPADPDPSTPWDQYRPDPEGLPRRDEGDHSGMVHSIPLYLRRARLDTNTDDPATVAAVAGQPRTPVLIDGTAATTLAARLADLEPAPATILTTPDKADTWKEHGYDPVVADTVPDGLTSLLPPAAHLIIDGPTIGEATMGVLEHRLLIPGGTLTVTGPDSLSEGTPATRVTAEDIGYDYAYLRVEDRPYRYAVHLTEDGE